jgi:hypothetical protein
MGQVLSLERRGYYRTEVEDGGTPRTLLLDILEDAPKLSTQQVAPVIEYFEQILESLKNSKLRSFKLFRKLPVEIRQMIWKYALPGERIFEVQHHPGVFPRPKELRASHAPLLRLIGVCTEACSVAQRDYQKVKIRGLGEEWVSREKFYLHVNFKRDMFYFSKGYMSITLGDSRGDIESEFVRDKYKIGIIAFDMSKFRYSTTEELDPPSLAYMSDLREVLFVQNWREFLPDTDQQDSGRPLFCTRSKNETNPFLSFIQKKPKPSARHLRFLLSLKSTRISEPLS